MADAPTDKVTIPSLRARKAVGPKIVCLTAYDFPTARILDERGVDLILVGDSLGMVVLGYETTVPVTMDEMIHHTRAVTRAVRRALVVADMPYFSFHLSADETIRNASRFLKEAGASAVKIEGASAKRLKLVKAMVEAEIPVMGHVGLTPQSILSLGRFKVRGKAAAEALRIVAEARALEQAGAFAVVLESVPVEVAALVTRAVGIPTIGIGAGPACDGQVLVFHDVMGFTTGYMPKFVRRYADLHGVMGVAVGAYSADVRAGRFPDDATSYHLRPEVAAELAPKKPRASIKKGSSPVSGHPLEAAREFASRIPVVEGGPAQRGEPSNWFPGPGSERRFPSTAGERASRNSGKNLKKAVRAKAGR